MERISLVQPPIWPLAHILGYICLSHPRNQMLFALITSSWICLLGSVIFPVRIKMDLTFLKSEINVENINLVIKMLSGHQGQAFIPFELDNI